MYLDFANIYPRVWPHPFSSLCAFLNATEASQASPLSLLHAFLNQPTTSAPAVPLRVRRFLLQVCLILLCLAIHSRPALSMPCLVNHRPRFAHMHSHSHSHSLIHTHAHTHTLSLSLCVCLSLSVSVCLSVCLSASLALSPGLTRSRPRSLTLCVLVDTGMWPLISDPRPTPNSHRVD